MESEEEYRLEEDYSRSTGARDEHLLDYYQRVNSWSLFEVM